MRLSGAESRLAEQAARLDGLSPLAVLSRGYSIARRADGRIVRASRDVLLGESIELRLHRGRLAVEVLSVEPAPAELEDARPGIAQVHKGSDEGMR
jgi:exodeoxyribonuclease VII large subunit